LEKLRATLNEPLFVKSGRGITPTEKAMSLLPKVQNILADWEGLIAKDSYDPAEDKRPFRLAAPTEPLLRHLQNLYRNLRSVAPHVEFVLTPQVSRQFIHDALADYNLDLAITVSGEKYRPTLVTAPFWQDELVICFDPSKRGPVTSVDDYQNAQHGVVSFGGPSKSEIRKRVDVLGIERNVVLKTSSIFNLAALIEGTEIITTMPSALAETHFSKFKTAKPPFKIPDLAYDMVWHRRYDMSARNKWLRELTMKSRVGQLK
jgi:DNA-binding transcriptional LysR family regulator